MQGFASSEFAAAGYTRTLFSKGEGPGVILLHELPGLTRETVEFADWLVAAGFHVAMPLLFGRPLQSATLGLLKSPALCIRKEFNCLATGKSSPITAWLRALCSKVHTERGGPGVGAIGMCFTGGFILSMMVEPALLAPVAAQPSLPFFDAAGLDVERETLARAVGRAAEAPLLALRFGADWRCKASRFERLRNEFRGDGAPKPNGLETVTVPGQGHSTLTFDYRIALERGCDTRQRVLAHLRRQLQIERSDASPASRKPQV